MLHLSRRAISVAAGALLLTVASTAASAHVMGGMHGFGGHGFGGHGHFGHGHFRGGTFIGFDDGYYGYGYGYGGGCGYLRHKAHVTGRPYWWRQYEACLDGY